MLRFPAQAFQILSGRRAFVWDIHGDEVHYDFTVPQGPRKPETLWDEYQSALAEVRNILDRRIAPQGTSSAECKNCHWYNFCSEQLKAADDLTLIAGLGRKVRDALQATLPTIAALAESNPDGFIDGKKTHFKGVGPDRLRLFHSRAALLLKSDPPTPFLRTPVRLPKTEVELFFDVEVDPMRDICYLHGVLERQDEDAASERFIPFFAETVSSEAERGGEGRSVERILLHGAAAILGGCRHTPCLH